MRDHDVTEFMLRLEELDPGDVDGAAALVGELAGDPTTRTAADLVGLHRFEDPDDEADLRRREMGADPDFGLTADA